MLDKNMPIGVIDSGVGGLSVLKALREIMPTEDFIYLGDTARAPYGSRPEEQVRAFVEQMLSFFDTQRVKMVVIACNTITVLGLGSLKKLHKFLLSGVSMGEKMALDASRRKNIGVFATEFTINTQIHKQSIQAVDRRAKVTGIACPKFVPLIEEGKFDAPEMAAAILEYTALLKPTGADTLLLACTHFPFIQEKLAKAMGPDVQVLDPANQTAKDAQFKLIEEGLYRLSGEGSTTICFTGDMEKGESLAKYMLPETVCQFKQIHLE